MTKSLLVNADDLGLSRAINAGIIQSHVHGIVRSTSIVASGEAFDEAVLLAKEHPELGVGVHLTLVEENSVSLQIPTLAPHGVLPSSYGQLVKKIFLGQIRLRDIELEFRAQIEKCLKAGLNLTHLDSHQHTHALPMIFPIAVRVANDYAIRGLRVPRSWPSLKDISADRFLPKCVLCGFAQVDFLVCRRGICQTTDRFAGLFESGALRQERLAAVLANIDVGTTELCCHPACNDDPRYASWNQRRQIELAALTSNATLEQVNNLGIELINYRQLEN